MRIAFLDFAKWVYTIDTPYCAPLGGSQSALCYLAEQLAALGHEVKLFNGASQVTVSRGVACVPLAKVSAAAWNELDFVVIQNWARQAVELRPRLRSDCKLILWTQHADDQPAMRALADPLIRDAHDGFAFVSDWQRQRYRQIYGIDPGRSHVLRNAVGPTFENLFPTGKIVTGKTRPPVLAYTSTPFRGMDVLLDVFPHIRNEVPGATLRVFSSMQVYQMAADRDAARYGALYDRCRSTPGVEYIGSLPQPELAKELLHVSVLAYPNTFAETSCIAVMEALASGCHVVTSDLAALPETMAGFGTLIPINGDWQVYREQFVEATVAAIQRFAFPGEVSNTELAQQVEFISQQCTWRQRAIEWQAWLAG